MRLREKRQARLRPAVRHRTAVGAPQPHAWLRPATKLRTAVRTPQPRGRLRSAARLRTAVTTPQRHRPAANLRTAKSPQTQCGGGPQRQRAHPCEQTARRIIAPPFQICPWKRHPRSRGSLKKPNPLCPLRARRCNTEVLLWICALRRATTIGASNSQRARSRLAQRPLYSLSLYMYIREHVQSYSV